MSPIVTDLWLTMCNVSLVITYKDSLTYTSHLPDLSCIWTIPALVYLVFIADIMFHNLQQDWELNHVWLSLAVLKCHLCTSYAQPDDSSLKGTTWTCCKVNKLHVLHRTQRRFILIAPEHVCYIFQTFLSPSSGI